MTAKVITFHSYKGGTGKSFLSLNTAVYLANIYKENVAILDFDFRAPTLIHKFKLKRKRYFLNDFLEDKCSITEVLNDISQDVITEKNTKNRFQVAYASPKSRDMQEMQMKSRQWQQRALTFLMKGLTDIKNTFDWIIIDSSPGFTYDSLNAMSSSDAVVLVATPDRVDVQGTLDMSADIYPSLIKFGAQPGLVLNKVPRNNIKNSLDELYPTDDIVKRLKEEVDIPVITRCPCFCDSSLLLYTILINEIPDHPLINNIKQIVEYLRNIEGKR